MAPPRDDWGCPEAHCGLWYISCERRRMSGCVAVGQAHLLEEVISMFEYFPIILSELTLTYWFGSQHGLYDAMVAVHE